MYLEKTERVVVLNFYSINQLILIYEEEFMMKYVYVGIARTREEK